MKLLMAPASGSIAGRTFARGRAGMIARSRSVPVNPNPYKSPFPFPRPSFGVTARNWSHLTALQQAAWNATASRFPRASGFGATGAVTGFHLYVAVNTARVLAAVATTTTPPSDFLTQPVTGVTFTAVHPNTVTVNVNPAMPPGQTWFLGYSQPLSNGVSRARNFTNLAGIGASFAGNVVLSTVYTARFGAFIAGQKLFLRVIPYGSGFIKGTPLILSAVAT